MKVGKKRVGKSPPAPAPPAKLICCANPPRPRAPSAGWRAAVLGPSFDQLFFGFSVAPSKPCSCVLVHAASPVFSRTVRHPFTAPALHPLVCQCFTAFCPLFGPLCSLFYSVPSALLSFCPLRDTSCLHDISFRVLFSLFPLSPLLPPFSFSSFLYSVHPYASPVSLLLIFFLFSPFCFRFLSRFLLHPCLSRRTRSQILWRARHSLIYIHTTVVSCCRCLLSTLHPNSRGPLAPIPETWLQAKFFFVCR